MDLTSLSRVKTRLGISDTTSDQELRALISHVSGCAERFLNRHAYQTSRTEQYDVQRGQQKIILRGYPVTTLTSIKNDYTRGFTGSAMDSSNYYADLNRGIVQFDRITLVPGAGVMQVVYTGGMGASLLRLTGVIGSVTGSMTLENTVEGQTSLARGTLKTISSGVSIGIDVDSGTFIAGETVKDVTALGTCTLSSISQTPIIMSFHDVVRALEDEIRDRWQRRDDPGSTNVSAEGVNIAYETGESGLLKRTEAALRPHRRMARDT